MAGEEGHVLVVDDDTGVQRTMRRALQYAGFRVMTAGDGGEALDMIARSPGFDLVILDVTLPKYDGFEVCRRIRESSNVPVIMVTARDNNQDVVRGLDVGADDYIAKPFHIEALLARVRAVLRRAGPAIAAAPQQSIFRDGRLTINFQAHQVALDGQPVKLTSIEYRILEVLAAHPGRLFTYDEMIDLVWKRRAPSNDESASRHLVQSHVNRLRRKIELEPSQPVHILTHPAGGYIFRVTNSQ